VNQAEIKIFYDQEGNTLTVWFGNPQDEYICEETGDEVVLMKDKSGMVIGFERLNFVIPKTEKLSVLFETTMRSEFGNFAYNLQETRK